MLILARTCDKNELRLASRPASRPEAASRPPASRPQQASQPTSQAASQPRLQKRYVFFHKAITNPSLLAQIRPCPILTSQPVGQPASPSSSSSSLFPPTPRFSSSSSSSLFSSTPPSPHPPHPSRSPHPPHLPHSSHSSHSPRPLSPRLYSNASSTDAKHFGKQLLMIRND